MANVASTVPEFSERLEPQPIDARGNMPELARRTIQVGRILQIVTDIANNPETSASDRLAASKLLLDKSLPSLTSMDVTVQSEADVTNPEMFKARLAMLIEKAGPALLSEILGERAKQLPVTIDQAPAPEPKEG